MSLKIRTDVRRNMKVEIITDEFCKWCDKAKELMQDRQIVYTELQLEDSFKQ